MSRDNNFPLSPTNTKRAVVLCIAYGLLVIAAACYYYIISGDRRLPLPYLFQVAVVGVCAWGITSRRRWAVLLAGVFAAWQVYRGVSDVIVLLNAGGLNAPASLQVIMWLLALRTAVLLALLLLLLISVGRERPSKG